VPFCVLDTQRRFRHFGEQSGAEAVVFQSFLHEFLESEPGRPPGGADPTHVSFLNFSSRASTLAAARKVAMRHAMDVMMRHVECLRKIFIWDDDDGNTAITKSASCFLCLLLLYLHGGG
jgi:hypothetical protein